jgi:hypothetical protein
MRPEALGGEPISNRYKHCRSRWSETRSSDASRVAVRLDERALAPG